MFFFTSRGRTFIGRIQLVGTSTETHLGHVDGRNSLAVVPFPGNDKFQSKLLAPCGGHDDGSHAIAVERSLLQTFASRIINVDRSRSISRRLGVHPHQGICQLGLRRTINHRHIDLLKSNLPVTMISPLGKFTTLSKILQATSGILNATL